MAPVASVLYRPVESVSRVGSALHPQVESVEWVGSVLHPLVERVSRVGFVPRQSEEVLQGAPRAGPVHHRFAELGSAALQGLQQGEA